MKNARILFCLIVALMIVMSSCNGQNKGDLATYPTNQASTGMGIIPHLYSETYKMTNIAKMPATPKIDTRAEFDAIFGNAMIMDDDDPMVYVDFEKQFVIAVILPASKKDVDLDRERLLSDGKQIVLEYSVDRDFDMKRYEYNPVLLVVVDRQYMCDKVTVKEVREYDD